MPTRQTAPTATTGTKDSAARPAPRSRPVAELDASFTRNPVLRLQRSAGNQAVLQVLRKTASEARAVPPIVRSVLAESGSPLNAADREFLEPRLGKDLGHVRIHDNAAAAESATAVGADAYTLGANVVFAAGQHRPETPQGRRLLAHELAHTLQQTAGHGAMRFAPATTVRMGQPRDAAEAGAERIADQVVRATQPIPVPAASAVSAVTQPTLQRQMSSPSSNLPTVAQNGDNVYVKIGDLSIADGTLPPDVAGNFNVSASYVNETGVLDITVRVPQGGTMAFVPTASETLTAVSSKYRVTILQESPSFEERGPRTVSRIAARLDDPRPTPAARHPAPDSTSEDPARPGPAQARGRAEANCDRSAEPADSVAGGCEATNGRAVKAGNGIRNAPVNARAPTQVPAPFPPPPTADTAASTPSDPYSLLNSSGWRFSQRNQRTPRVRFDKRSVYVQPDNSVRSNRLRLQSFGLEGSPAGRGV